MGGFFITVLAILIVIPFLGGYILGYNAVKKTETTENYSGPERTVSKNYYRS